MIAKAKKKNPIPFSKGELEILISLVRSVKSDFISSEEIGIKVPEEDQKKVYSIEKRLESQLACMS